MADDDFTYDIKERKKKKKKKKKIGGGVCKASSHLRQGNGKSPERPGSRRFEDAASSPLPVKMGTVCASIG